ncbi:MAG: hypothetical protein ACRDMJ_11230 [Solirubrobacteraceae bacterium]
MDVIALPLTLDVAAWLLASVVTFHRGPRLARSGPAASASMFLALAGLFIAAGTGMPDWCAGIAVGGAVLAFFAITCVMDPLPRTEGGSDDDEGGSRTDPLRPAPMPGGDGGAGPDGPRSDPSWWPEFERDFRRYAARDRPRPRVIARRL